MWPESVSNPRSIHDLFNYRVGRLLSASSLPVLRLCEAGYGIARREWGLMAVLGLQGEMSPSQLATEASVDRPRTSRVLGQLIAKGLVVREEVRGDRRLATVRLTPEGRRVFDEILPRIASINERLLSVLSSEELVALDGMLTRLSSQARSLRDDCELTPTQRRLGGRGERGERTKGAGPRPA